MMVCIDTNVLIQARARSHDYHCLLRACAFGRMVWAVSTPILVEYREVVTTLSGSTAWDRVSQLLDLIESGSTLLRVSPSYQFRVISADPDDNAFTDCAITAGADYVITDDRHFAPLANAGYKPQPISPREFIARYRSLLFETGE